MGAALVQMDLLDAARTGDRSAIGRFLRRLTPWLRSRARLHRRTLRAPVGVSTLAQETSLRFSRKIGSVYATSAPQVLALLDQIMQNTARDARRAAVAVMRGAGLQPGLSNEAMLPDPDSAVSAPQLKHLAHAELRSALSTELAALPERQRQALLLHGDGASPAEIAEQMGCTAAAASMLVSRARQELRRRLTSAGVLGEG